MPGRGFALVAEDDTPIRTLIERLLEREGFEVEGVPDGRWAIEQINKRDFNVLVIDLMMPGASGYSILNHLEKNKPDALKHVIIITAAHGTIVKSLQRYGIHGVLKKPFDLDHFRTMVLGAAGDIAQANGAPVVGSVMIESGSCPPNEHRWREVSRSLSDVMDVVTEACDRCGSTRTVYVPREPQPPDEGS